MHNDIPDLNAPDFDEQMDLYLDRLPRNQEGLALLLDFMRSFDCREAWMCFFEDFSALADEETCEKMRQRAHYLFSEFPY